MTVCCVLFEFLCKLMMVAYLLILLLHALRVHRAMAMELIVGAPCYNAKLDVAHIDQA